MLYQNIKVRPASKIRAQMEHQTLPSFEFQDNTVTIYTEKHVLNCKVQIVQMSVWCAVRYKTIYETEFQPAPAKYHEINSYCSEFFTRNCQCADAITEGKPRSCAVHCLKKKEEEEKKDANDHIIHCLHHLCSFSISRSGRL